MLLLHNVLMLLYLTHFQCDSVIGTCPPGVSYLYSALSLVRSGQRPRLSAPVPSGQSIVQKPQSFLNSRCAWIPVHSTKN